MKFYINKIILWLDNGEKRELQFYKNKVNIITGEQSKGKSTIIEILDYCFFASENPIVQGDDYIDRVSWFGINFFINEKHFTIVRHSKNKNDYFFSSSGELPDSPHANLKEENIKNAINFEFGINDNVVFPYGGKEIKKGSKISPRYFLLFNTQRRNVLSSDESLFDKQSGSKYLKYQEALTRIFDLALGVTTIDNLIKQESLFEKEYEKSQLEKKQELLTTKSGLFNEETTTLCQQAKTLNLVNSSLSNDACINELKLQINNISTIPNWNNQSELDTFEQEKMNLKLKLSKYKRYLKQYQQYKKALESDLDSLKPIIYLQENFSDLLEVSNLDVLIDSISMEFKGIKEFIFDNELPAVIDLQKTITALESDLIILDTTIKNISSAVTTADNIRKEQLLFLGEVKSTLKIYNQKNIETDYTIKIEKLQNEIHALKREVQKVDRSDVLDTISEYMQEIFREVDFNLSGYQGFKPVFDYKTKLIHLKKIDEKILYKDSTVKNIGSSSNHLFLHLAFFTAIHRLFAKEQIPYIPPFLILDQPDSPYYETNDKDSFERQTFFKALRTLDNHISYFTNMNKDFQIIVLEHIEWTELEKAEFKNFVLVDREWRHGHGLVPPAMLI